MPFQEFADDREITLVLLDEGHMSAVLEDDEFTLDDSPRGRLGPIHRACPVVSAGDQQDGLGNRGEPILDLDGERREVTDHLRRVHDASAALHELGHSGIERVLELERHHPQPERFEVPRGPDGLFARPRPR